MKKQLISILFILTAQAAQAQVVVVDCGGAAGIQGKSSVLRENPAPLGPCNTTWRPNSSFMPPPISKKVCYSPALHNVNNA